LTPAARLRHAGEMKFNLALTLTCTALLFNHTTRAAVSAPPFYGDPPDEHHPWAVHDGNRPQPLVVTPGTFSSEAQPGKPPSDAVVLFNGQDLSNWQAEKKGGPAKWLVQDGVMQVVPKAGTVRTKEEFGDCQLHIEWAEPKDVQGTSQARGNSGVFLMGLCEIQVMDSYHNVTYADGHAASVYGVSPPMANALRPPGEFQVYDIVFRRPIYKDSQLVDPGYVTVFVNGVLAQDHAALEGPTGHKKRSHRAPFPEKGPLALQDHGSPVRFRNIWYRPLPPRAIEGGTDGWLTAEATMAKRKQIAADIRQDAGKLADPANPGPQLLRLIESLVYDRDDATVQKVEQMTSAFVQQVKQLPADQTGARKDEAKHLKTAFDYLAKSKVLPPTFGPKVEVETLVKDQHWDKKS
jgi:prepilin-type processing-associated H-X9-DG protein